MAEEEGSTIYIVDDDARVTAALSRLVRTGGFNVETYSSVGEFLDHFRPNVSGCIVLDVALGDWNGLDLQRRLKAEGSVHPIIFISGESELYTSVQAMKAGAVDFLVKPVSADDLFQAIYAALEKDKVARQTSEEKRNVKQLISQLTPREYEVLRLVVQGKLNKQIAYELGIVEKTAKVHRARVMAKMHARNVTDLVRMADHAGIMQTLIQTGRDAR
jgi:FixJ family two-component response regulator